jgi:DNA-binding response OmpR family regulator
VGALRRSRILIVDDEPAVRALVMRALQEAGYEAVAVKDGEAGLEAARSAGVPYDLVVTNNYMPSMTGEQLIGHLRGLFPTLPILHLDDLSHPLGPHAQMVTTLYKPFSITTLLEAVATVLMERPARQEA